MSIRVAALALALSGCEAVASSGLLPFSGSDAFEAIEAAKKAASVDRVLFACGPSSGLGVYASDHAKGIQDDSIKNGRIVFAIRSDGRSDIIFRDAVGRFISAVDDGGVVVRKTIASRQEGWHVYYPETGVSESHNITETNDKKFIDLWVSSKPTSMVGPSAKLLQSHCVAAY